LLSGPDWPELIAPELDLSAGHLRALATGGSGEELAITLEKMSQLLKQKEDDCWLTGYNIRLLLREQT